MPAKTFSRPAGSHAIHFASGSSARTAAICACSVGEVTVVVSRRSPAPAARTLLLERELDGREQRAPGPDLPALRQRLRPVGVVHVEDRGLREDVRAAEARRMELVAVELDGPPLVALREHAAGVALVEVRRGVEERLAGDDLLRRLDVGVDPLGRLARAAGQAREGDRGAHERQKLAAVDTRVDRHPELAVEVLAEILRLEQLLEAPPVLAALETLQPLPRFRDVAPSRHPEAQQRRRIPDSIAALRVRDPSAALRMTGNFIFIGGTSCNPSAREADGSCTRPRASCRSLPDCPPARSPS